MTQTILFPTEFSAHAPTVFLYALEMAQRFNAKIVAFHATRKLDTKILLKENKQKLAEEKLAQLKAFTQTHRPPAYEDILIEHMVTHQLPSDGILEIIQEENIQLIVMGMTGKSSVLGSLFGSVAKSILKKSTCSVLAIPAEVSFKPFINMVTKMDFTFHHLKSLSQLQAFAESIEGKIHCFHELNEAERFDLARENMSVVEQLFPHKEFGSFTVRSKKLDNYIDQLTLSFEVDLVVFLAKQVYEINYSQEGEDMNTAVQKIKQPILMLI